MENITLKQLAAAAHSCVTGCDENLQISAVVTDSRKLCPNSLFVALRGERFDGHNFAQQALKGGAVCCVVDRDFNCEGLNAYIAVDNTQKALEEMAAFYRRQMSIPVVAITGSVGKTSTKDMVYCVLKRQYNALRTEGNFNNAIGLPLTVFNLKKEHEIAVLEMGMSSFGEISLLTHIAAPETALITNIGFSHIEHLGSQENILKAKLEILEGLSADGTVILNGDDPFLWGLEGTLPYETIFYGIENKNCDISAFDIKKYSTKSEFSVSVDGETFHIVLNAAGTHHIYNALAGILTGLKYNIPMPEIIAGIADFVPGGMRQKIEPTKSYVLIRDCYNASPTSMKSGLEVLAVTKPKNEDGPYRRVAILGDMLELGSYAESSHRAVGALAADFGVDCLIAVGENAKFVAEGAIENGFCSSEIYVFYNNITAKEHINEILKPNDVILLKGSRGMRLEELADFIAEGDA